MNQAQSGTAGVLLISVLLLGSMTTGAQEADRDSVAIALAPRAEGLIIARCSVCHSPDLISQQRLPQARWHAVVEKMIHWGAQLSKDEADVLTRYLSARYHPAAPDRLPPVASDIGNAEPLLNEQATIGPLVGVANRGQDLFARNCQACHGTEANGGMGPKLAKNPILKHEDLFWDTVLHGRGPMPAWDSILTQQEIADLYAWLLTR
ncbi:MAG TPA: c-type cytochrome [Nitrospira sp.]|nr:c-type cytochrome [Nitrospira sp.]